MLNIPYLSAEAPYAIIAIAIGLLAFVVLVYVVSIARMGANVLDRPL